MKGFRKIVSMFLIVVMMFSMITPTRVVAADGDEETITDSNEPIKVGDTVFYRPDYNEYIIHASESGIPNDQFYSNYETSGQWKVVAVNDDGTVSLINSNNDFWISLKGKAGFNNGVKILNNLAYEMYANDDLGITARSINIDDFGTFLKDKEAQVKYEDEETLIVSGSDIPYPAIIENQNGVTVNGETSNDVIGKSDYTDSYILDDTLTANNIRIQENYKWYSFIDVDEVSKQIIGKDIGNLDCLYKNIDLEYPEDYLEKEIFGGGPDNIPFRDCWVATRELLNESIYDDIYEALGFRGIEMIPDLNPLKGITEGNDIYYALDIMETGIVSPYTLYDTKDNKDDGYFALGAIITVNKDLLDGLTNGNWMVRSTATGDVLLKKVEYREDLVEYVDQAIKSYGKARPSGGEVVGVSNFFLTGKGIDDIGPDDGYAFLNGYRSSRIEDMIAYYLSNNESFKLNKIKNDGIFGLYTDIRCNNLIATSEKVIVDGEELNEYYMFKNVPIGNYYVKELKAPTGYKLNTNPVSTTALQYGIFGVYGNGFYYNVEENIRYNNYNELEMYLEMIEGALKSSVQSVTVDLDPYIFRQFLFGSSSQNSGKRVPFSEVEIPEEFDNVFGLAAYYDEKASMDFVKIDKDTGKKLDDAELSIIDPVTGEVVIQDYYEFTRGENFFNYNQFYGSGNGNWYLDNDEDGLQGLGVLLGNSFDASVKLSPSGIVSDSDLFGNGSVVKFGASYIGYGVEVEEKSEEMKWNTTDNNPYTVSYLEEGKEYILRETKAPDGYKLIDDIPFVFEDGETLYVSNEKSRQTFSKVVEGKDNFAGAELQVEDMEGNVIDSWTSTERAHEVVGLVQGKPYKLVETLAPEGYSIAEPVLFVAKDGENVTIKDNPILTKISVVKKDGETGEIIKGKTFEFGIYSDEECTELIKKARTDTENGKAVFEGMEYGTYYIKELKAPEGYSLSEDTRRIIIDSSLEGVGEEYVFDFDNKPLEIVVVKVDEKDNPVEGATLQLINKETEEVVDEWVTDTNPHRIEYLVEGKRYIVREKEAPEGYFKAEDIEVVAKDGQEVKMVDSNVITNIEVVKVDKETGKEITDKEFEFGIYKNKACTDAVKDEESEALKGTLDDEKATYTFENIPYGTYYIKEIVAPDGYKLSEEVVKIVVDEKLEIKDGKYSFQYKDEQIKMILSDIEMKTEQELEGAEIEVVDKATNKVVDSWTVGEEPHVIENIVEGKDYIMRQKSVPDGYYIAEDIEFTAEDNTKVIMKNKKILTNVVVTLIDEDTKKPITNENFEIKVYRDKECTQEATEVTIDKSSATATFIGLEYGKYYIKQTKIPTGYEEVDSKIIELLIDKNLAEQGKTYKTTIENKKPVGDQKEEEKKEEPKQVVQETPSISIVNNNIINNYPNTNPGPGQTVVVSDGSGKTGTTGTTTYASSTASKYDDDAKYVKNVPNTELNTRYIYIIVSIVVVACGIGVIVYSKRKETKEDSK